MSKYMLVLLLAGIGPFVLTLFSPVKLFSHARALFASIALIVIIFGSWDIFATYRGHWHFDAQAVYPFRIINLPLEEVLFFVVIPFCGIFTWEVIKYIKEKLQ